MDIDGGGANQACKFRYQRLCGTHASPVWLKNDRYLDLVRDRTFDAVKGLGLFRSRRLARANLLVHVSAVKLPCDGTSWYFLLLISSDTYTVICMYVLIRRSQRCIKMLWSPRNRRKRTNREIHKKKMTPFDQRLAERFLAHKRTQMGKIENKQ